MVDDHHYFLFPNTVCNVYAGHFITARIRPEATDAERCYFDMFIFNWLSDEERSERRAARHAAVDEEPRSAASRTRIFSALPNVQLGMHSTGSRASCSPSRRSASCTSTRSSTSCCSASEFGGEGQRGPGHDTGGRTPLQAAARAVPPHGAPRRTRGDTSALPDHGRDRRGGSPHRNRATGGSDW